MATLKSRVEQAEDKQWLQSRKRLLAAFNGRSMADLEFFVAHGDLPEIPIPGTPVDKSEWPVRSRAEVERLLAGRSIQDKELFCAHGYWPGKGRARRQASGSSKPNAVIHTMMQAMRRILSNTGVIEMFLRRAMLVSVVLYTVSTLSYCSSVTSAEAAQWREDLHFFAEQAPQVHKNLYHTITREKFDAAVKSLDERIPTLSRDQITTEIMRIVAMIGDGHTHLEINRLHSGFRHYAVKFYWFPDGIYIVQADKQYAPVVGGKVLKLGKVSGQEAYEAVRQVVPHDNESQIKGLTPLYMTLAEVLDGLGLVDDPDAVPLVVEKNGVRGTAILKPEEIEILKLQFVLPPEWVDARDPASPVPLWLKDPGNFYWFQYLKDSHTIYVQFNAVAEKPDETIEAFFKRVFAFADAHPVDRFVLDERLNDGGNNELLRPIIHGFIRSDKVNQPGKLFTIIGRHTFSAAMNCVNRMKLNTDTLFVGEPTASSPNHYGDNAPVVLPNSKLTVRLSTLWWQDMDPRDTRVWQAPDLSAQLTFADYQTGRDPVMDLILHYKPGPSISEIVRTAAKRYHCIGAKDSLVKFQKVSESNGSARKARMRRGHPST